jgi:hypothetical protein
MRSSLFRQIGDGTLDGRAVLRPAKGRRLALGGRGAKVAVYPTSGLSGRCLRTTDASQQ